VQRDAYGVSYYKNRMPHRRMLLYTPVIRRGIKAGAEIYTITTGGLLIVPSADATYRIRFTQPNGYMVMARPTQRLQTTPGTYGSLRPVATEYSRMPFIPKMPYMLATWVPGKAIEKNIIDFERKDIWFDPLVRQFPDILVYDRDYNLKFALDGVQPDLTKPADKGYLFPWRSGQVLDLDPLNGRCHVGVDLEPDNRCLRSTALSVEKSLYLFERAVGCSVSYEILVVPPGESHRARSSFFALGSLLRGSRPSDHSEVGRTCRNALLRVWGLMGFDFDLLGLGGFGGPRRGSLFTPPPGFAPSCSPGDGHDDFVLAD
jgi:hypothetical protein